MTALDIVGLVGVTIVLVAYPLVIADRLDARGYPALGANLLGASLILVSLVQNFNVSAAAMEFSWAAVALVGIIHKFLYRARTTRWMVGSARNSTFQVDAVAKPGMIKKLTKR